MTSAELDYSQITDYIFIGTTPTLKDYENLKALGIGLVINMRAEKYGLPLSKRRLIKTIWVPTLDHKYIPISSRQIVRPVKSALAAVEQGDKVYIYCLVGRHRSVLMGAALLIAQGYTPQSAIRLIKSKRLVADPEIPHIYKVIEKFAALWRSLK